MTPFDKGHERLNLAKSVSLIGLIKELGYSMEETSGYYRMLSPFRSESQPSFDIDRRKVHKWRDRGTGKGGDIIDFVQELYSLNKADAITYLLEKSNLSLPVFEPVIRDKENIEILSVSEVHTPYLVDYIAQRKIMPTVAQKWLVELEIRFPFGKYPERTSRLLGFKNNSGGYEMRNKFMKIGNSPKDVTTIKGSSHECINLYEGFFSFLSDCTLRGTPDQPCDAVILNTLSFLPQMLSFWGKDVFIYSHLDNDTAGDKATKLLQDSGIPCHDMRSVYKGYNDLNDLICDKPLKNKKGFLSEILKF